MTSSDAAVEIARPAASDVQRVVGRGFPLPIDFIFRKTTVLAAFLVGAVLFATVIAITYDSWLSIKTFG